MENFLSFRFRKLHYGLKVLAGVGEFEWTLKISPTCSKISLVLSKSFKNFPTLPVICQPQFYFLNFDPNFRTWFFPSEFQPFQLQNFKHLVLSNYPYHWLSMRTVQMFQCHVTWIIFSQLNFLKVVRVRNWNEFELF